jgi:hypothetical protein
MKLLALFLTFALPLLPVYALAIEETPADCTGPMTISSIDMARPSPFNILVGKLSLSGKDLTCVGERHFPPREEPYEITKRLSFPSSIKAEQVKAGSTWNVNFLRKIETVNYFGEEVDEWVERWTVLNEVKKEAKPAG